MSLTDLWQQNKQEVENKHIQQLIGFTGDGKLRDGNNTSIEFRHFLANISSKLLISFADQCLEDSFKDSGLVLQDIVNQMGKRLGFTIEYGRYRGSSREIGYDGLWNFPNGHTIIAEVKTTDAFRLSLDVVVEYRDRLVRDGKITEQSSSILLIVGREDTGDLEAQIRGSRHAWDIRLISVDALSRLMLLKESVEDPRIVQRIYDILVPREYTKLDDIVDILFSTAEDVKHEEIETDQEYEDATIRKPVSFYEECIERIEKVIAKTLIKRSRVIYSTPDDQLTFLCVISKEYERSGYVQYWFAFHPHQREVLEESPNSYIAFGCGSPERILVIPLNDFLEYLDETWVTERNGRVYWHIVIMYTDETFTLVRRKGKENIDLTNYRIQS